MQRRSVVITGPQRVEVVGEPLPPAQQGQLLVHTAVSAISPGTEMLFYRGQVPPAAQGDAVVDATLETLAQRGTLYPLRYGYACVGRIEGVASADGADADSARAAAHPWIGQLVFAFSPHTSHFWARPEELLLVPHGLDPVRAALLPNMETAVNFVMDGRPGLGERVAVVGQGIVGLLTLALLRQFPLQQITVVDPLALRRTAAERLGADLAIAPEAQLQSGWEPADLVYEVSGNPAAVNTAIALTGFAGRIVLGSWYGQKQAPIDLGGAFHRSRIRLIASQVSTIDPQWSGRWDKGRRFAWAWQMLERLPLDFLISHRFGVDAAPDAYQLIDERPGEVIQAILTYDQHECM
jgi:2-desacetyl-2-hydroxyethyl bacteriochlorophyllide A dehydrogenase